VGYDQVLKDAERKEPSHVAEAMKTTKEG
jgi:hypothetical protein